MNDGLIAGIRPPVAAAHKRYDRGGRPPSSCCSMASTPTKGMASRHRHHRSGYHCLAFDLLGFGESPQPSRHRPTRRRARNRHREHPARPRASRSLSCWWVLHGRRHCRALRLDVPAPDPALFLLSTPFYLPPRGTRPGGSLARSSQATVMRWAWAFLARGKP